MLSATRSKIQPSGEARAHKARIFPLLLLVVLVAGCDDDVVDRTPPAIPSGVFSITADQQVILQWTPNREVDLAGYSVLWNDDGGAEYYIIDSFDAFDTDHFKVVDAQDPSLDYVEYVDAGDDGLGLLNGSENFYAVLAFDHDGNESDLSLEYIRDVPRPEGTVVLEARDYDPSLAGFDFSSQRVVPYNSPSADVWLEVVANVAYFNVDVSRVRIQDYGPVGFDVLSEAPDRGWSTAGRVEAILDHSYALEILAANGVNYGKLTVIIDASDPFTDPPARPLADLDWGYQPVVNEWQFKGPASTEKRRSGEVRVRGNAF